MAGVASAAVPRLAWSASGGTLRSRTYADMRSLDPAFSQGVVDEEIQGPIYNKLIRFKLGPEWGWQLDAAAMVEQPDPTHIKFALRDDIGFTNGFGAMTAEDVKFSFERIIDESLESTNKPDWGPLDHVEARPWRPRFLPALARPPRPMVSRHPDPTRARPSRQGHDEKDRLINESLKPIGCGDSSEPPLSLAR